MSGGRFEYIDSHLKDEIFGWSDTWKNVFEDREISELVWDVLNLIHDFDWYASGDTCKETYLKAKAEFKKKWLGNNRGLRIRRIVDTTLAEAKAELYETFGMDAEPVATGDLVKVIRCKDCKHYMDRERCPIIYDMYSNTLPDDFCSDGERRKHEQK